MAILMYLLLCLIWGSTWLAIKIGLTQAAPLTTAALRFLLAVTILTFIAKVNKYPFPKDLRTFVHLGYPGVYMYGFSYALIYLAEQYISSALTAILFGSFPFFVALLSAWRLKHEPLRGRDWLGLAIGFGGVVLISYDSSTLSGELLLGSLLAVGATAAAAWGMVLHKQRFLGKNIVVAADVQMISGGVFLVAAATLFEFRAPFVVSLASVGSIVYLAVFGTVVTFLGYYWLMRRMTAVMVSSIAFVTPLVAVFFGVGLGGESLTPLTIVGTVLILSGIGLILRRQAATATHSGSSNSSSSRMGMS